MTGQAKSVSTISAASTNEQLDRMATFNSAAMEIFAEACQTYVQGVATLNEELMKFVNSRLDRDIELSCAMSECSDWSGATKLQQHWMQQATQEYLAEASKLTNLASKITKQSWGPVLERANRMLTEVNKPVA